MPGFVGSRLTEAREARQLTMVALADLAGVSRQIISEYEKGSKSPSVDVLGLLADRLAVPMRFFITPTAPERAEGPVFFRSLVASTLQARQRAVRRRKWLERIVNYLRQFIVFPPASFPDPGLPEDPRTLREIDIEQAAIETRQYWNLGEGPVPNMVGTLEGAGGFVVRQELGADKLDSLSEWGLDSPQPYFVLGTDKASAVRSRFDAAHELGHMILHRRVSKSLHREAATFSKIEEQANAFAGAFLLPERTFVDDFYAHLGNVNAFVPLKSQWMVSIQAMLMRAKALNLLSEDRERNLWRSLSRQGWRLREPLDDNLEPEAPRHIRRSFDLALAKGFFDRQTLELHVNLRAADIESVCGLPPGYLESSSQPVELKTQAPNPVDAPRVLRLRNTK
ncbi:MAG: XRE family transcriptional regulator [Planctomycetota bacterium]|nr:XRE family transcriptional regulator [Planctomycetota bacterium]